MTYLLIIGAICLSLQLLPTSQAFRPIVRSSISVNTNFQKAFYGKQRLYADDKSAREKEMTEGQYFESEVIFL
jgi:hypothetical protein